MDRLERTRRAKIVLGILAVVFFVLFLLGYGYGGDEMIMHGFINEPLPAIVMVSSFFCAVVCFIGFFIVNALEKDIAEWLEILEKRTSDKHQ